MRLFTRSLMIAFAATCLLTATAKAQDAAKNAAQQKVILSKK